MYSTIQKTNTNLTNYQILLKANQDAQDQTEHSKDYLCQKPVKQILG